MKFFFDTSISPRLVRALHTIVELQGNELVCLKDRYTEQDVPDTKWIKDLGIEGDWIIISADPRISRNKAERAAWKESHLTAFFFSDGWASQHINDQAADLLGKWRDIVRNAKECEEGSGFLIRKSKEMEKYFHNACY